MGCCAQGVVNVTAGMVGLPGGRAAQDLHSMLQLVNVACEIIRTSIMQAEEFTREANTGAVDQLCCSTAEVLLE